MSDLHWHRGTDIEAAVPWYSTDLQRTIIPQDAQDGMDRSEFCLEKGTSSVEWKWVLKGRMNCGV
jgi:capsular polysaccharide biosynthesis protein